MGRFEKVLVNDNGIDKRDSGYYSTPDFVSDYISNELLELNPNGKKVLDPAVGDEELLKSFFIHGKEIDSFDVIEHGNIQYSNFLKQDFIAFYKEQKESLFFSNGINLDYDYYIANPPYNCHELDYIKDNKSELKKLFGNVGVHNMYSMFLSAIVDCAKEGALIGVIVSDSFLTATMHSGLRQQLLDSCSIHQLILCPNDLFWSQKADVRTCIMVLQKGKQFQDKVKVSNRPKNAKDLERILETKDFLEVEVEEIVLSKKKTANQFIIDIDKDILSLFQNPRIGEVFNCITGISTGNDKKYLSKEKKQGFEIPFYKNPGSKKFVTTEDAYLIDHFMDESLIVKDFMVRNKKFVFNEGITCSSMGLPFSACYLPENSTFGVNPNIFTPKEDLFWVLAYLNSHLITYLVRGVLIRSNMVTSGYISQLPIIPFNDKEKDKLTKISKKVLNSEMKINIAINKINAIVYNNLKLNESIIEKIDDFALNLSKRV
ncbi:HsdM family class I SAM-dependent methyltransferase [Tenacibaculum retecalamus]|uniref:HsdM family class I SAM-dependent methyltransferase n=1 Tax=Tenacibaculum retecalamus TaxID=3018315 RepID=UPI0023D8EBD7|nr:N-6 DNA methylase [Tenacibaculum retecalamus]WBX70386.1 N-6 DNA methylase [Tenacibaculum retecalamus]